VLMDVSGNRIQLAIWSFHIPRGIASGPCVFIFIFHSENRSSYNFTMLYWSGLHANSFTNRLLSFLFHSWALQIWWAFEP
jgi:hypothetical protein